MAEAGNRKLTVEICNAKNLMPKDGQGTASAYAIVDFDGQRRRTKTKFRDLNPQWDEKLEFLVHDPESMPSETLEINVYNDKKTGKRNPFLGKVKISGASISKSGSETLVYYPLEKRSVFSQIKGEIGLKVFYADENSTTANDALPAPADSKTEEKEKKSEEDKKKEEEKPAPPPEENKNPTPTVEETKTSEEKEGDKKPEKAEEEKKTEEKKPEEKPKEEGQKDKEMKEKTELPLEAVVAVSSPSKLSSNASAGELDIRSRGGSSYDLVERIPYLFVRVLKAKHTDKDRFIYAKVSVGTHSVRTRSAVKDTDWDQVFAFHKASLNSTALDISVWAEKKKKDGETETDTCLGVVSFDLPEVPKRSPPDSPLAPQWYTLEGENAAGIDIMLATWVGTQVDEAFQEAWQSDSGGYIVHTRSKAYLSPKLCYLRLTVIQTQDLRFSSAPSPGESKARASPPELYVKAQLGAQVFKTAKVASGGSSGATPCWNEDLVFVAAEPFDPFLLISVEDASVGQSVGHTKVHLSGIHRRVDDKSEPPSRWFNLAGDEARPYAGRIHVRVCLEGGYHVLDEAAHVTSDVRAASKQLSKPAIGLLEVGIRGATNLLPMKMGKDGSSGTTDAYVVLKYGPKWARTRTIIDQFNPQWNEQYTWEVYDPCTVLSIGVFDNVRYKINGNDNKPGNDVRIGKVRIRLSTLDTNRVYLNHYPLMVVHPTGAKKMGEIELAIRFTCSSWMNLVQAYASPMLPRMHYVRPLGPAQQDLLRHNAMRMVSTRLARSEPPLGPEVVQYMLDTDAQLWSMRRSKANWFRVVGCLSWAVGLAKWVHGVRTWAHPSTTVLVHLLLVAVILCPNLILPTLFMYLFFVVSLRYRTRPRDPTAMDARLSCVDVVGPEELDEEFDGFPTSRSLDQVRVRYDRLRSLAGRAQSLLGDVAAQGERVDALMNWRDPRATGIFVAFCLLAALLFYVVPFKALALGMGMYYLRHPRFRGDMPAAAVNFFRRLPSLSDRIL